MKYLPYLLTGCLISSCSYVQKKMKEQQIKTWNERIAAYRNTLRQDIFLNIHKESLRIDSFLVSKSTNGSNTVYTYQNDQYTFAISFDSSYQRFTYREKEEESKLFTLNRDTTFTLNDHHFRVFKLFLNTDIADGSSCYFFSPDVGVLVYKSMTWLNSSNLSSQKNGMDPLILSALLMKLYTANDFASIETPVPPLPSNLK